MLRKYILHNNNAEKLSNWKKSCPIICYSLFNHSLPYWNEMRRWLINGVINKLFKYVALCNTNQPDMAQQYEST